MLINCQILLLFGKIVYNKYMKKLIIKVILLLSGSIILKYYFSRHLLEDQSYFIEVLSIIIILIAGAYIIFNIAKYIEDITAILKDKTGLAGGLLQAFGTAFPDMALGITAAIISLSYVRSDHFLAIQYAIVAASTTFGSNIYNIGHAAWCIWRQNLANKTGKTIKMFPVIGGGQVSPLSKHNIKPTILEINTAIKVLTALSLLTTVTVLGMVFLGQVDTPVGMTGDLYQLKWYIGIILAVLIVLTLYIFRKNYGSHQEENHNPFCGVNILVLWVFLVVSGVIILFTAEAMIESVIKLSELTHLPTVASGLLAGIIGCLGEMLVIHNFTVNPRGRIGDAIVGVAMDNIVTILGASIIAIMGGIFLGGASLIIIFVVILCLNIVLVWQVAELKDEYIN
jgi:Ca2+/Na+ antiporter